MPCLRAGGSVEEPSGRDAARPRYVNGTEIPNVIAVETKPPVASPRGHDPARCRPCLPPRHAEPTTGRAAARPGYCLTVYVWPDGDDERAGMTPSSRLLDPTMADRGAGTDPSGFAGGDGIG